MPKKCMAARDARARDRGLQAPSAPLRLRRDAGATRVACAPEGAPPGASLRQRSSPTLGGQEAAAPRRDSCAKPSMPPSLGRPDAWPLRPLLALPADAVHVCLHLKCKAQCGAQVGSISPSLGRHGYDLMHHGEPGLMRAASIARPDEARADALRRAGVGRPPPLIGA